jgi:hypothetical protein
MSRSLFVLLLGALHAAPCLGGEGGGDGATTSTSAPVSVSPPVPALPAVALPILFAAEDSGKAVADKEPAARGLAPSTSPGNPRPDRQAGPKEWPPFLDGRPFAPGQPLSSRWPVPFCRQTGPNGRAALPDGRPSDARLSYRSPFPTAFSLAPTAERSDQRTAQVRTIALQDRKPPAAAPSPAPPGPGTSLPAPLPVRSSPAPPGPGTLPPAPEPVQSSRPTGQSGWFTFLDGRPIDVAPVTPQPAPGQLIPGRSETVGRFGWWGGGVNGSPVKVGEYQGLASSPFWDVDSIRSDGRNTLDFWGSQLNSDSYDVQSQFYRDGFKANVDFEQFPHLLGHEPPAGGTAQSTNQVVSNDLNLGEDYAVRVQQLKVGFSGPLTDNISWKLKVWEFRKFGERQSNSMAHCFNVHAVGTFPDNRCHVLSQQQRIDWLTMEIEPGIVGKFDRLTVDYALTLRSFTANDEVVTAPFNHFGAFGGPGTSNTVFPYAIVPNSTFLMNRLKLGYDFTNTLRLYSYLYSGNMENLSRDTNNSFGGFDLRLIKTTASGITATAYAKLNENHSQLPPFLLPEEQANPGQIWHPINYTRFWTGLDGQWFPFRDASTVWRGFSLRANYEYHEISRAFATYPTDIPADYVKPPTVLTDVVSGSTFTQPTTRTHQFVLASRMRWNTGVITYARYQMQLTQNPLYGMDAMSGVLNTNLPTNSQLVEIGGSWSPLSNLLFSVRAEIQSTSNNSHYANFAENNYPVLCTIWYAPTPKLSISAGYSYFSNWVNQDVTMGYRGLDEPPPAETLRYGYNGQTQVVNLGARYAWTEKLTLSGGIFWTDGYNVFSVPQSQTGADWSQMPLYSNVRAESMRYQGGFDYRLSKKVSCYFRVNVFDYQDQSQGQNTGLSYFLLGGLTGSF